MCLLLNPQLQEQWVRTWLCPGKEGFAGHASLCSRLFATGVHSCRNTCHTTRAFPYKPIPLCLAPALAAVQSTESESPHVSPQLHKLKAQVGAVTGYVANHVSCWDTYHMADQYCAPYSGRGRVCWCVSHIGAPCCSKMALSAQHARPNLSTDAYAAWLAGRKGVPCHLVVSVEGRLEQSCHKDKAVQSRRLPAAAPPSRGPSQ